jgi:hypothetical protein
MPHQLDVFVDALDLAEMGFDGADPAATGRENGQPCAATKDLGEADKERLRAVAPPWSA